MKNSLVLFACSFAAFAATADVASRSSSPIALDTIRGRAVASPISVGYNPKWVDGAGDSATVKVIKVFHVGTEQSLTDRVEVVSSTASTGTVSVALGGDEPEAARLLMVVEEGGVTLGELSFDMSLGATGSSVMTFNADSRPDSLQIAADAAPASIPLKYSTAWADGAASCRIDVVNTSHVRRSGDMATVTTNTLATLSGAGEYAWSGWKTDDGEKTLLLTLLDGSDNALGDPLSASFDVVIKPGFVIIVE